MAQRAIAANNKADGPAESLWIPTTLVEIQRFQASRCSHCRHDQAWRKGSGGPQVKGGCAILAATLACELRDPRHPRAWSHTRAGLECSHFEPAIPSLCATTRCPHTLDMLST